MRRAVFLDRDGVLNRAFVRNGRPFPPSGSDEFELLAGVVEACHALKRAGFLLVVVTNQPDVARGTQRREVIEQLHRMLESRLPLDDIRVCYHDAADACSCRKPSAGMLLEAANHWQIDLPASFMVGDRWRDVDAGRSAGCKTIFIDYGYAEQRPVHTDRIVRSLSEAADWILSAIASGGEERGVKRIDELRVKLFADGADKAGMLDMYRNPFIKGFTTNPTLMRKAGVLDCETFAHEILREIPDRPMSFEVFADDFEEMERQALAISSWGENVYVKIPVTNTKGEPSSGVLRRLAHAGVKLNVTALMTVEQVRQVSQNLAGGPPAYVSVFAGRIADTGRDPVPVMALAVEALRPYSNLELIWASPRELLNVFQADAIGCPVITATNDILKKLSLVGKDLKAYSLETVQMFYEDARKAGYRLDVPAASRRAAAASAASGS